LLATPHAVAEHLDAKLVFDVVVFDEASRLPAAHAMGALARARAAIVVGDRRQPAPGDGADGLLDVALAAGLPELALGTHYRSRHEDLFAFANRRYYGDRLELLPAASRAPELGISWRRVDGAPDSAGANRAEADAVVVEVVARRSRSIAVVAMSRAQQYAIEDALDAAGVGGVLVGTPDRLQGEERDVVILSIGHAADELGALAHPGGERWLDVAITRAREQLVVVSSFAPEDVVGDAPGARNLADFLAFARDGRAAADVTPASPIVAAIARALTERGWSVRHRVGCGAYRIDLAVVDPDDADRYVLAIEHDGAAYASGSSARDRDRLRAQVLVGRGWRLHRIWSLDWWTNAEREIQRAHGAIVAAIAASRQRRTPTPAPVRRAARGSSPAQLPAELASGSGPTEAMLDGAPLRLPRGAIAVGPYVAASVPAGRRAPDDMFAPRHLAELGKVVEQVLAAEAPMHVDLLARRVGAYFGIGRVTERVTDQVRVALAGRGQWGEEQGVVWRLDQDPASVPGVRVAGTSASARREIDEVPLSELAAAARIVVERSGHVSTNELIRDCARLLGFARITARVSERVSLGVRLAAARELIAISDDKAQLPS
jgi:very-short-patch-repair endonuclease